jgi:hypothetical protein
VNTIEVLPLPDVQPQLEAGAVPAATTESLPTINITDLDRASVEIADPGPVTQARFNDLQERFTRVSDEKFELKAKLDSLTSRFRTAETLDSLIQPYASKAYWFMVLYSVAAALLLVADGFKYHDFDLPDEVLKLLVGSTAVTVIGLVGMVLTGIFVGARKAGS